MDKTTDIRRLIQLKYLLVGPFHSKSQGIFSFLLSLRARTAGQLGGNRRMFPPVELESTGCFEHLTLSSNLRMDMLFFTPCPNPPKGEHSLRRHGLSSRYKG